jgi:hypothetical protein
MRKRPWEPDLLAFLSVVIGAGVTSYFAKPGLLGDEPPLVRGLLFGMTALIGALRYRSRKYFVYAATSMAKVSSFVCSDRKLPPDSDIFRMLLIFRSSAVRNLFIVGVLYFTSFVSPKTSV